MWVTMPYLMIPNSKEQLLCNTRTISLIYCGAREEVMKEVCPEVSEKIRNERDYYYFLNRYPRRLMHALTNFEILKLTIRQTFQWPQDLKYFASEKFEYATT